MIEDTIRDWVKRNRLSAGDDLLGFVMDCDAYLGAQDIFSMADVQRSEDPLSMVNAALVVKSSVPSLQDISRAIKAAWTEIAYREFQASSLRWCEEATVFRFVTGDPLVGLGVTGTFIATGDHYARLVDEFRAEFGKLGAKIQQLPGGLPSWAAQPPHAGGGGRSVKS
jgi:hypothetical protein